MTEYDILEGLPPYGTPAKPFTPSGHGTHMEGFVVRFRPTTGEGWVGNFVAGGGGCSTVLQHPNGRWFIVISRGQGYVVDPETRSQVETFGATIDTAIPCPDTNCIIFGDGLRFFAVGPEGLLWRTRRIAWGDGVRNARTEEGVLLGETFDPMTEKWSEFEVDAQTGNQTKGAWVSKDGERLRKVPTKRRTLFATVARFLKGER
jgi:hypothetical protein